MAQYDIIAIGGCDSFANYFQVRRSEFNHFFRPYHNNGGDILFMHNFFSSKNVKVFRPLADLLGYIDTPKFYMYNEITFNDACIPWKK